MSVHLSLWQRFKLVKEGRWDTPFRFDPEALSPKERRHFAMLRADPRFEHYDDRQLEMMLLHHTPEEVLKYGPEQALARCNDLSFLDGIEDLGL